MPNLVVVKYGGSLLSSADAFRTAASYVVGKSTDGSRAVVLVSAMSGLTNRFMDIYDRRALQELSAIENIYWEVAKPLPKRHHDQAMEEIKEEMKALKILLEARNKDAFVGSAEGHSAILQKYHILAQDRDAAHLSGADAGFLLNAHGLIDMEASRVNLRERVGGLLSKGIPVVGGYLGRHHKTDAYQLGARNSNDGFAAALAVALGAQAVEIVKDVPGVFRVYPREDLGILRKLSYNEAGNMSWTGSPVVHPSAIIISESSGLPIVVKNMQSDGTVISTETETTKEKFVASVVPERTFMVTIRDRMIGTYEGMGYWSIISSFEEGRGNAITPVSAMGGISYTLNIDDRKKAGDNETLFRNHIEELRAHLNANGFRASVVGDEVGRITLVGDAMQSRQGTFYYLTGILSERGISLRSTVQIDEKVMPPVISIVVDSDNLESTTTALTEELFTVR